MNSAQFPLTDAVTTGVQFAHGLSAPPVFLRAVTLCTSNDPISGITAGTETALSSFFDGDLQAMPMGFGANATFIFLSRSSMLAGAQFVTWNGASNGVGPWIHYSLKVYWK